MEQGALSATGIRRVWAGAGQQCAVYWGGDILHSFQHSLLGLQSGLGSGLDLGLGLEFTVGDRFYG